MSATAIGTLPGAADLIEFSRTPSIDLGTAWPMKVSLYNTLLFVQQGASAWGPSQAKRPLMPAPGARLWKEWSKWYL